MLLMKLIKLTECYNNNEKISGVTENAVLKLHLIFQEINLLTVFQSSFNYLIRRNLE